MKIRFAQIEPTTRCNYTCGFCAGRHMPQGDLDFSVFERFIAQVDGLEHVELQGEGEPLLHPRFFDMVGAARRRFPALGVSFISNGSMFTADNIARILDNRISQILVSIESADDRRFQEIRGGALERVRRGIRALLEARGLRGATLPTVGFAVTVLRSTVDDVFDSVAPLYRELGLDGGISVQTLQAMPQYVRFYDAAMRGEMFRAEDGHRLQARLQVAPELARHIESRAGQSGFYQLLYGSTAGRLVCPWLENGLYLGIDGTIAPCCYIKDGGRFGLGRVDGDGGDVLARRSAMAAELAAGDTPPACAGCRVAQKIVAVRTAPGPGSQRDEPIRR